jgi:hypothetical protein
MGGSFFFDFEEGEAFDLGNRSSEEHQPAFDFFDTLSLRCHKGIFLTFGGFSLSIVFKLSYRTRFTQTLFRGNDEVGLPQNARPLPPWG